MSRFASKYAKRRRARATCDDCGKPIRWIRAWAANRLTYMPLDPGTTQMHECEEDVP